VDPKAKRLFVIDGAKALRAGINRVFGAQHPVQRCRNHKIENVCQRLPEEQKAQVKAAMRASYKLEAKDGMARLRKLADWLEQESPVAANSLREGLEECFTLNRLSIPPSLHRCLATTNLIESPQSGVRTRTRRVCRWRTLGWSSAGWRRRSWRRKRISAATWAGRISDLELVDVLAHRYHFAGAIRHRNAAVGTRNLPEHHHIVMEIQ
jgi:hypothetical protein